MNSKPKYNVGRCNNHQQCWAFGIADTSTKPATLICIRVEDRTKETLLALITRHVKRGSIIHSDCWRAYNDIAILPGYGYQHMTVRTTVKILWILLLVPTPRISRVAGTRWRLILKLVMECLGITYKTICMRPCGGTGLIKVPWKKLWQTFSHISANIMKL